MPLDARGNSISVEHALRAFCTKRITMSCSLCGITIFDEDNKADDRRISGTHHRSIKAVVAHFKDAHPDKLREVQGR